MPVGRGCHSGKTGPEERSGVLAQGHRSWLHSRGPRQEGLWVWMLEPHSSLRMIWILRELPSPAGSDMVAVMRMMLSARPGFGEEERDVCLGWGLFPDRASSEG